MVKTTASKPQLMAAVERHSAKQCLLQVENERCSRHLSPVAQVSRAGPHFKVTPRTHGDGRFTAGSGGPV
jgi:hypothetical protein